MALGFAAYPLALAAGGLSTLSPCVLPLLPILLGTAVAAHRLGAYALGAGLTLSFTVVGVFIATLGAVLGLDQDALRTFAAALLIVLGVVLLSARLQQQFVGAASGVSRVGEQVLARVSLDGLSGQFVLGLLLGIVWSPCVGPTLGAAATLASQGQSLGQVTLLMALFGVGAAVPMIAIGVVSRGTVVRLRGKLLAAGQLGKHAFGAIVLSLGMLILSGGDKAAEAWLVKVAPHWLVQLTTSL